MDALLDKMPRWIKKEIVCDWCKGEMLLYKAFVSGDEESVEAHYECENIKCRYYKTFKHHNPFAFRYTGKGFVDEFRKATDDVPFNIKI